MQFIHEVILRLQTIGLFMHENGKTYGELRKFISLGRKILTLQIDPLPCEHPLESSVPFRSVPFWSVPFRSVLV